jgi:CBS domain containing-hemolysin-like protein
MNASTAQDMTIQEISLRLAVILLLIAINAFFVTAEFAVVSVRRSRVNQLVVSGDRQARGVQRLQEQIDRLLSTTQLGITLSSLALGWIGERVVADIVAPLFTSWLGGSSYLPLIHLLAVLFTFGFLAYLQIVLGELIPKSLALIYAEQSARALSTPSLVIARIFMPLVWVLNHSTNWILRRLGIADNRHSRHQVSSQELELMIATERESVGLDRNQRRILSKIFGLSAVTVADVMVPKPQMQTVPATATWRTVVSRVAQTNFSRYPVTGESPDDLVGTIHFRDLAKPLAAGQINLDSPIRSFIRPLALVPKATSIDELLLRMQEAGTAMAMVVDEYGGIVGLLTRKDAIAEILGKQKEDYPKPSSIVPIGHDHFLVQAQIPIDELNDCLGIDLPVTEGYQTLAGFLLYKLQQMPVTGETYKYQNLEFTVALMDGTRIDRVRIRRQAL